MVRVGNLMTYIEDYDNIMNAVFNSSKNKSTRKDVQKVLAHPDKVAEYVQNLIINETYKPKYSKLKGVNDGVFLKRRYVCEPRYNPDQIVHWSIYQKIEKIILQMIPLVACGSVSGRGQVFAKNKVEKWLRTDPEGMKYCIKLDVKKCYDNINHDVLLALFKQKFKDKKFLRLIKTIIRSYHSDKGDRKGIAIGWVTSQVFSMFQLTKIDNYLIHPNGKYENDKATKLGKLRKHIRHHIRYMDDIYIFLDSKKAGHKVLKKLKTYVSKYLDLELKENHQLFRVAHWSKKKNKMVGRKIDFVGFTMGFCKTGIRKSISKRIRRCFLRIRDGRLSLRNCMAYKSYYGWIKHANAKEFLKEYRKGINGKVITAIIRQGVKRIERSLKMKLNCFFQSKSQIKKSIKRQITLEFFGLCLN